MINHGGNYRFQFITCTLRDSPLSITIIHYQTMHTTDKRIASWSERANVYKEYMARSRHEAPQKNTSRRSRGSIEGRLEAPMKGLTHHTNTAINTQSKHWHRSMNRLKIPPNPSTPDLPVGAMPVFEQAPCPLQNMESMHSICPSTPFIHPHQNTFKYYLSIARCLSTRWC